MREIRLYIEGGGASKRTSAPLRRGFQLFFSKATANTKPSSVTIRPVMGGSASETCKDFALALQTHPEAINLLLLDSDCPVSPDQEDYSFMQQLHGCQVSKDTCNLMVQVMEAWFLADRQALRDFYGNNFNDKKLPNNPQVEAIDKELILSALKEATRNTNKKAYHKINHASELLASIDPAKVRQAAPHCDRLLAALEELVAS